MNFHKTQENGDATSNYNITTSAKTVREFVYEVIEHAHEKREWGSIFISTSKNIWHARLINYTHSKVDFLNSYSSYCNKPIERVWANGGWGAMTYFITCKEE